MNFCRLTIQEPIFSVSMKDGAAGMRQRVGMRAYYSTNTQQVERGGVLEEGRCDNILGEG
jgi:hypothetical protein